MLDDPQRADRRSGGHERFATLRHRAQKVDELIAKRIGDRVTGSPTVSMDVHRDRLSARHPPYGDDVDRGRGGNRQTILAPDPKAVALEIGPAERESHRHLPAIHEHPGPQFGVGLDTSVGVVCILDVGQITEQPDDGVHHVDPGVEEHAAAGVLAAEVGGRVHGPIEGATELGDDLLHLAHEAVENEGAEQGEVGKKPTPLSDRETSAVCGGRVDHLLGIGDGGGQRLLAADVDSHLEKLDGYRCVMARSDGDERRVDSSVE